MNTVPNEYDFTALHAAMQRYVDGNILAGVSFALMQGRDLVDVHCVGWADREQQIPLRTDHLFRVFSNTKLVTSCAAMLLLEEGRFQLDDPIENYIPQLGNRRVLKPGASRIDDTEPAHGPITIRHLLSHTSGLSYGLLDIGTLIFNAYTERNVRGHERTLAGMVDALIDLPLTFHPGTSWEYSVAIDVIARLVEIVSGESFGAFLQQRIFDPLGMADTFFVVPENKQSRLTAIYRGADPIDPMKPGLTRADNYPYPGAYLKPVPMQSGGGGLVSTLPDMVTLLKSLMPGGATLLKPETISLMMTNQLPGNVWVQFPGAGPMVGRGHGLAGSVCLVPGKFDPKAAAGEFRWGGLAGTQWWINPRVNRAGVFFIQREMGFFHPAYFEYKRLAYQALELETPATA